MVSKPSTPQSETLSRESPSWALILTWLCTPVLMMAASELPRDILSPKASWLYVNPAHLCMGITIWMVALSSGHVKNAKLGLPLLLCLPWLLDLSQSTRVLFILVYIIAWIQTALALRWQTQDVYLILLMLDTTMLGYAPFFGIPWPQGITAISWLSSIPSTISPQTLTLGIFAFTTTLGIMLGVREIKTRLRHSVSSKHLQN